MKISILGTGITKFGELWDQSLEDLFRVAVDEALAEAQVKLEEVEAIFVANMGAGAFSGQLHLGALVSSFFSHYPPAVRVEGACASGSLALIAAQQSLLSKTYETVLVVGAEKMTDVSAAQATRVLAGAADLGREYGSTFPALYAMLAQAYEQKHGPIREALSAFSVQNHKHALENQQAQFHKELNVEQVSSSAIIATPLRLLDCSPLSDGAAAVVLTRKSSTAPKVLGFGQGMDSLDLARRKSLTSLEATKRAMMQALQRSEVALESIQAAEVHDCFTIAGLLAIEDLGFAQPGKAGKFILDDRSTFGGRVVINPSGGLKACGHPVGATGVKQVAYLARSLREGKVQRALAHNVGGSGATAVVHILEK